MVLFIEGDLCIYPECVTTQMKAVEQSVVPSTFLNVQIVNFVNSVSLESCEMLDLFRILLRMRHFD